MPCSVRSPFSGIGTDLGSTTPAPRSRQVQRRRSGLRFGQLAQTRGEGRGVEALLGVGRRGLAQDLRHGPERVVAGDARRRRGP